METVACIGGSKGTQTERFPGGVGKRGEAGTGDLAEEEETTR